MDSMSRPSMSSLRRMPSSTTRKKIGADEVVHRARAPPEVGHAQHEDPILEEVEAVVDARAVGAGQLADEAGRQRDALQVGGGAADEA
ncbi:MAG: hypothetical protein MUE90_12545 [Thermoanaerobaculales bacterium]|nr:hypothetical protein [Thermoanaerobaculales bacterium]